MGRHQEAIEHYEQALRLESRLRRCPQQPGARTGPIQAACERRSNITGRALRLKPDSITICNNLALAYANMQQSTEAIAAAQKALELARSQGQTEMAKQIEDWLNAYRVKLSKLPNASPSSGSNRPAH